MLTHYFSCVRRAYFCFLPIDQALKLSRISLPLNIDDGDNIMNELQIVRREFNACTAKILFEAM